MIIHIDSPCEISLKKLAKKLAKSNKFYIIDLEKLEDITILNILDKYKKNNKDKLIKKLQVAGIVINKNLENYIKNTKKKFIILIGYYNGFFNTKIKIDYKFALEVNLDQIYKNSMLNFLDKFDKYKTELKNIIESAETLEEIDLYIRHKMSIRISHPHPPRQFNEFVQERINNLLESNYLFMSEKTLYNEIVTKL